MVSITPTGFSSAVCVDSHLGKAYADSCQGVLRFGEIYGLFKWEKP